MGYPAVAALVHGGDGPLCALTLLAFQSLVRRGGERPRPKPSASRWSVASLTTWRHAAPRKKAPCTDGASAKGALASTSYARPSLTTAPCAVQRQGTTVATQIDHVTPLCKGGTDDWENLQPLCGPCHELKNQTRVGPPAEALLRRQWRSSDCRPAPWQ